jgi:hypothetical protein
MAKRRRRGREFWTRLIGEFEAGGGREEHQSFADRQGVRCDLFRRWLYKLRSEAQGRRRHRRPGGSAVVTPTWPLVEIQGRRFGLGEGGFEVELLGGVRLHVPPSFDQDALRRLLAILGEARSA